MTGIKVLGTGKGILGRTVSNNDLAQIVDTSDEWISQRTGMRERHHVNKDQSLTQLAEAAAQEAIEDAKINPEDIGVLVVATLSADNFSPSTACLLQERLGLKKDIIAFDLNAACSGFVFGLETVRGLLMSTKAKYALLIGAEVLSKKLDMTDRSTCVLFGDGASAAVVSLEENKLYCSVTGVESDDCMIYCRVDDGHINMDGQATYKFAVATVPKLIEAACNKAGVSPDEIDHYLLHQANLRIIESIAQRLKAPREKFLVNIEKYGNTSAASLGLVLDEGKKANLFKKDEKILLCAFGAGKTYGAVVMEW